MLEKILISHYEKNGYNVPVYIQELPNHKVVARKFDGSFEYYCNTIASAKRYVASYFRGLDKKWQEVKVCPECFRPLELYMTDYSDYHCNACNGNFTIHGEKAVKH